MVWQADHHILHVLQIYAAIQADSNFLSAHGAGWQASIQLQVHLIEGTELWETASGGRCLASFGHHRYILVRRLANLND